jgi:hypothetical protein
MIRAAITIAITENVLSSPYDIDSWWLLDASNGAHSIGFGLGSGFMIYSLKALDTQLRDWILTLEDCAVADVDTEDHGRHLTFNCDSISLPVPEDGPPLRFLDGPMKGDARVVAATLSAATSPFAFNLQLVVKNDDTEARLHLSENGVWRLVSRDAEGFAPTVRFSAKFEIGGATEKSWWNAL